MIITTRQLGCLNEENNVNVSLNATGNNISSFTNAVTQNKPDILAAGKMGDPIIHISNPNSQNGSNDDAITQHVEVGQGESIENAMQKQLNPTAVEEARLAKMRNEGRIMTKKELRESFLNQQSGEKIDE